MLLSLLHGRTRQKEICDQLGISRATVSRLLKAGKENGVVRIELIIPTDSMENWNGKLNSSWA